MINSLRLLPKLISKVLSKEGLFKRNRFKAVTGFDLFYQLTYMSAVAAAGISRSRIFLLGASLPRVPAVYFERIHMLAQKMSYDYATACSVVGLAVKSEAMTSLLLRLSSALRSGQPEMNFLAEETQVQGQVYEKEYERDLAALTKWTDAYASVTVSAALMIVINMTSSLIYPLGDGVLIALVVTSAVVTGATGWILSRAAPKETLDLFSKEGPWTQRWSLKLSIPIFAAIAILCPPLILFKVNIGIIAMIAAAFCSPWASLARWPEARSTRKIGSSVHFCVRWGVCVFPPGQPRRRPWIVSISALSQPCSRT